MQKSRFSFLSSSSLGFTLVEMAITATIMIIASSMLIVFTQSGGDRLALTTEQAKIGGVLNRAKSLALQRYRAEGNSICGFAFLYGEPANTYAIAPVFMSSSPEDPGCLDIQEPIETFTLDRGIVFDLNSGFSPIIFESPYLNTKNPQLIQIRQSSGGGSTVGIEVTAGGAIVLK